MMFWQGSPEAAAAGLRQFGWSGPGESPAEAVDPRIGGFIPPIGQPAVVLDGVAYVALVATSPIPPPAGLDAADPELSRGLIGSF
jgi:hypothetical protein